MPCRPGMVPFEPVEQFGGVALRVSGRLKRSKTPLKSPLVQGGTLFSSDVALQSGMKNSPENPIRRRRGVECRGGFRCPLARNHPRVAALALPRRGAFDHAL